ncbi:MAG: tRNA lysidine(34) synthetase TilS [Pseudomonadota bacterium]
MAFGADFSALINRFSSESHQPIALAVSGGSDSLALLLLCRAWAIEADRSLIVFTVDHGLREEARIEAQRVSSLCDRFQIPHRTLQWTTPKPSQNAARQARYALIAEAMADAGARCLLTGHTLDDVVETAFMRRRRGVRGGLTAGPGLAAPMPVWPKGRDMTLLRPLIHSRRKALRAFLIEQGVSWTDDPSNQNLKFERVQVRSFFERHPNLREGIVPTIRALQSARSTLDITTGHALAQVSVSSDGLIELRSDIDDRRLLGLLARMASGRDQDPRHSAVAEMVNTLTEPGARQTLGGAWFQRTQNGFLIGRDPAKSEIDASSALFDGRYARDSEADFPNEGDTSFLVRHARPPSSAWREILSDRIAHLRLCLETPDHSLGIE